MKVRDIKEAVVKNNIEEKAFFVIININEEEITKDVLKEILDEIDPYDLAIDYVYTNNEKDLLKWYLENITRLYKYANQAFTTLARKASVFKHGDIRAWS